MAQVHELSDNDLLFQVLNFIAPMSGALRDRFSGFMTRKVYPKKSFLLREGEVSRHIFFIVKGYARCFFTDKAGNEHTTWFMGPMDVMISVYSFYRQMPAAENIEILEDSVILSMTWDQVQIIYAEFPEFNFHGRILTENYYIRSEERAVLLRTKKPAERYKLLLETNPQMFQKATLWQVASFLAITPETLSRIRAVRSP